MMDWLQLVAVGMATWRVSAMVSYEKGPFDVFWRLRRMFAIEHDQQGKPSSWPNTFMAELLVCPWCNSIWIAAPMWGIWQWRPELVYVLAIATIAVAIERWCNG